MALLTATPVSFDIVSLISAKSRMPMPGNGVAGPGVGGGFGPMSAIGSERVAERVEEDVELVLVGAEVLRHDLTLIRQQRARRA